MKHFVKLNKGREKTILEGNRWIFSGAINRYPANYENGDIVGVVASDGVFLGYGYFNKDMSLAGRMLTFNDEDPLQAFDKLVEQAVILRRQLFNESETNSFRLINSEADGISGLVVDRYGDYFSLTVRTIGANKLKSRVVELIREFYPNTKGVYEKSFKESDPEAKFFVNGILFGDVPEDVLIKENNFSFIVNIAEGQKTGFFLDQRDNRKVLGSLSKNKTIMNMFGYSGGFSIYALGSGAAHVDTVDISKKAQDLYIKNLEVNGLANTSNNFFVEDCFEFLKTKQLDHDIVILDPPAFAKSKRNIEKALYGYREINRSAMQKMKSGSLLFTFSCSYFITEEAFIKTIYKAAKDSGRRIQIVGRYFAAKDHVTDINHCNTNYLKGVICSVF